MRVFLTYMLLNSSFIPISLLVTIEFIKIVQAFIMNNDYEMYSELRDQPCRVKTASINEELGQVRYVFTDKTGTLTRNVMEFKLCKIGKQIYGDQTLIAFEEEKQIQDFDIEENLKK